MSSKPTPTSQQIDINDAHPSIKKAYQLRNDGKRKEALLLAQNLDNHMPNMASLKFLNGVLYYEEGELDNAKAYFLQALSLDEDNLYCYYYLSRVYKKQNDFGQEKHYLEQYVNKDKSNLTNILRLSALYMAEHHAIKALQLLNHALKYHPEHPKVLIQLAAIYVKQQQYDLAIALYDTILTKNKNDIQAYHFKGYALMQNKDYHEAIECFNKVIEHDKNDYRVLSNLAACYYHIGDKKKANDVLTKSLDIFPDQPAFWLLYIQENKQLRTNHPQIQKLLKFLRQGKLTRIQKRLYNYAMGHLSHREQAYDQAFTHFQIANQLNTQVEQNYTLIQNTQTYVIKKMFSKKLIQDSLTPEYKGSQPVFIIGAPQVGKSLLESFISAHADIQSRGEIGIDETCWRMDPTLRPLGHFPFWLDSCSAEDLISIRQAYINALSKNTSDDIRFLTDTSAGNVLYVGLLYRLFPHAKYIFLDRKMDSHCIAMYFKSFVDSWPCSNDIVSLACNYNNQIELIKHWKKMLPKDKYCTVSYEKLLKNSSRELGKVFKYLGVSPMDVDTTSINSSELNLAKYYKNYLGAFKDAVKSHDIHQIFSDAELEAYLQDIYFLRAKYAFEIAEVPYARRACYQLLDIPQYAQQAKKMLNEMEDIRGQNNVN